MIAATHTLNVNMPASFFPLAAETLSTKRHSDVLKLTFNRPKNV